MWIITVQEGDVIFKIWILKITDKGFLKGLNSALRLTGMLFAGSLFIATTRLEEIGCGMEKLGIPGNFSFSLITAVRLIPLYLASLSQIIDAQTSRGHVIDTRGLLRRIKNYVPLLIPAFLSSIRNINHLSMALEVRGFSNRNKRTSFLEFKLSFIDYVALITISAVFLFTVYEVIIFYF
jgi:energy-coupling factor transport system permease protein